MISRYTLTVALLCYLACCLILYTGTPIVLMVIGLLAGSWRLRVAYGKGQMLRSIWIKLALLPMIILTLWLSQSLSWFEMIVNLVMLGYSLKFIEIHKPRDIQVFCLTGFVLIALSLVFHLQWFFTLAALGVATAHLWLLYSLDRDFSSRDMFTLGRWLVAALPTTIILFLLLPRLAPLWHMPAPSSAATGLSDRVAPGDISLLIRSDALVFRAEFEATPPVRPWYWRAMVLDSFDGQQWSRSDNMAQKDRSNVDPDAQSRRYHYQLMAEPSVTPWIATLTPSSYQGNQLEYLKDGSWRRLDGSYLRAQFEFEWIDSAVSQPLHEADRRLFLQRPPEGDPRMAQLVGQWQVADSATAKMMRMRGWFFSQPFTYTLRPSAGSGNNIASFLFETQRGFCVHYAQAAVVLTRLMGIPARMVTGYLGGEWQQGLKTVTVRQFDAHAWMEYWDGERWIRLDPTSWVAPDRVESDLRTSLATSGEWGEIQPWMTRLWYGRSALEVRLWMARMDYYWARWVVNFDSRKQMQIMREWLGIFNLFGQVAALLALLVLAGGVSWALLIFGRRPRSVKRSRRLRRQLRYLKRKGFSRNSGEGLMDFAFRIKSLAPEDYPELKALADSYYRQQFARKDEFKV